LSLCLTNDNAMKTCEGSGCIDPRFLNLGTSWMSDKFHAKAALSRVKKPFIIYCIGGWVGPRAGLDVIV
jgi:hypothetical protein